MPKVRTSAQKLGGMKKPARSGGSGGMFQSPARSMHQARARESERVPTFFTYVFGTLRRGGTLNTQTQGPHTVAHAFIERYVDTHCWGDIFDEQIEKYTPAVMEQILSNENILSFDLKDQYLNDYWGFYDYLATCRRDGVLADLDSGSTTPSSGVYLQVHHAMMCLLEMHPYGSYGWNRSAGDHIAKQEIAGKGESMISMDNYHQHLDKVVDLHGRFNDMAEYRTFLETRVEIFRTSPDIKERYFESFDDNYKQMVSAEAAMLMRNVRFWASGLSPDVAWFVRQVAPCIPLSCADEFFRCLLAFSKQSYEMIDGAAWCLALLQRYHAEAVPEYADITDVASFIGSALVDTSGTPYFLDGKIVDTVRVAYVLRRVADRFQDQLAGLTTIP